MKLHFIPKFMVVQLICVLSAHCFVLHATLMGIAAIQSISSAFVQLEANKPSNFLKSRYAMAHGCLEIISLGRGSLKWHFCCGAL